MTDRSKSKGLDAFRSFVCISALAVACTGLLCCSPAAAASAGEPGAAAPWPDSPFTMMNTGQRLEKVLTNFTQTFGLRLQLDEPMPDDAVPATGRAAASSPTEFLNQLGAAHGFVWYQYNGSLYVGRAGSRVTRLLPTKGLSGPTLRRVLTEMGLVEAKFGWSDIEERGSVMVSGPASYVGRLEAAVAALPDPSPAQEIQVYRLKYAAVDDRVISYREKQITTPGVATILRNLIAGNSGGQTSTEMVELAAPLRTETGKGASDPDRADDKSAAASGKRSAGRSTAGAVIQADPRLNAIIVKDKPQNAPIYRALIELLDVPSSLVEIEAMIVDVNSSSMSELGVDWTAAGSRFSADTAAGAFTLQAGGPAVAGVSNLILARISALEGKGTARIVSRPSILTQDNMSALIDLAETFYIQSTGERVAQVTPVTVGVTLRVTPRIVGTGDARAVQLVVDIEDGGIQSLAVGNLPIVRRSSISTQAMVAERQSLVIGGLNSEQDLRRRDGVPVLQDIPAAGALFRKDSKTLEKRERLFLITPRVIAQLGPAAVPAAPAVPAPGLGPQAAKELQPVKDVQ